MHSLLGKTVNANYKVGFLRADLDRGVALHNSTVISDVYPALLIRLSDQKVIGSTSRYHDFDTAVKEGKWPEK